MSAHVACSKCESLQSYHFDGTYKLYIYAPLGHSFLKMTRELKRAGLPVNVNKSTILLTVNESKIELLSDALLQCLTEKELQDSKALLIEEGAEQPSIDSLLERFTSLSKIVGIGKSKWLIDILKKNGLTTYLQPIVHREKETIFAYECLLRAYSDDRIITPDELFSAARSADLLFYLDREARITAIQNAHKLKLDECKIFINFNPSSIYDPNYCLRTTNEAAEKANILPKQIVFEVIESDFIRDRKQLVKITDYYRAHGYGVALDDLGAGYSSLNLLSALNPDYIKLDIELIRNVHQDKLKLALVEKMAEFAEKLGIKTIAEGVETLEELQALKKLPIDYFQGYYFAKPKPYEELL